MDLRDCTVTLQYASTTYTGKALRPTVKVQYNDIALVRGRITRCSTAPIPPAVRPGEVDRHTGDYTGAVSRSFKILPGRVTGMSTSRTTTTITMNWKQVPALPCIRCISLPLQTAITAKLPLSAASKAKISKLSAGKKYYFKIAACGKRTATLRRSP